MEHIGPHLDRFINVKLSGLQKPAALNQQQPVIYYMCKEFAFAQI